MILGIDTSFANYRPSGEVTDIDWEVAIGSKQFSFVYARVGQGSNPANLDGELFNTSHDQCKKAGMPFGCYYFFVASQDGNAQAATMLQAADGRYGTLRPMIDVEEASFQGAAAIPTALRILNLANLRLAIAKAYNIPPTSVIIYTNSDTWANYMGSTDAFMGSQLWIANPTGDPTHIPSPIQGFNKFTLYQYSWTGQFPGMMGDVDMDALYGTLADISL
jgi:lysozyme